MKFIFNILLCLLLCAGVSLQIFPQVSWMPCELRDEHLFVGSDGHSETRFFHRDAGLQFGHAGDSAVHPEIITVLVTSSKVDMRRYVEGAGVDQVECEIHRYSTEGIQMRWPGLGATEQDQWFTCTLKHVDGLFVITTFLRNTPATTTPGQADYRSLPAIGDRDTITTSAVMAVLTRSPSLRVGLRTDQKLHCQFTVDHKGADLSVEWHLQRRGERTTQYSYSSRSGKVQGSGVGLRGLTTVGDASLNLPFIKLSNEGTYICSVNVPPLYVSLDVILQIQEPPRVSLNVDSTISLQEGGELKVVCEAEGYYPLDVDMEWLKESESVGGSRLPQKLTTVLYSSHRRHQDGSYSLSAFFYLKASLQDTGSLYSCRVFHSALRMPVRKSFTLTVTEVGSWLPVLAIGFILLMVSILCPTIYYLNSVRQDSRKRKPY